jgi:hypothetical protein
MNWSLRPRRHWSGFGPGEGNGVSGEELAGAWPHSLGWALSIIALGGVAAYLWLGA